MCGVRGMIIEEIWFDQDFWQIVKNKVDIFFFDFFLGNGILNGENKEEIEG